MTNTDLLEYRKLKFNDRALYNLEMIHKVVTQEEIDAIRDEIISDLKSYK